MNVKEIRRKNMLALAQTIGGISAMAERLGKSQSQISHLIGTAPIKDIGHRIAAEVERAFNKPEGWLDKEHDNFHLPSEYHAIPLIGWDQLNNWKNKTLKAQDIKMMIPLSASAHSFALKVNDDTMESKRGISFPKGSLIIVDPKLPVKHGSFVVAQIKELPMPTFKRLIIDGRKQYLNPLNTRYPIQEISNPSYIYGVVRLVLMFIE